MPRRRKSCWHWIDVLAGGQGHSLRRSTSLPKMPWPRYIYGNMAGNPAEKAHCLPGGASQEKGEVPFTKVSASAAGAHTVNSGTPLEQRLDDVICTVKGGVSSTPL